MATIILRTLFISILLGLAAFGVVGLGALVPASVAAPILIFGAMMPVVLFYLVSRQVILMDTRRRLLNRDGFAMSEAIRTQGMNLDFHSAPGTNLRNLDFEGFKIRHANLTSAKLSGANCQSTDFANSKLEQARLNRANLKKSSFWKANLKKAKLLYANLKKANLKMANLKGANLKGANLYGAKTEGTKLDGAVFNDKTVLPFTRKEAFARGMKFVG